MNTDIRGEVATSVGLGMTQAITLWLALTPPIKEVYDENGTDAQFIGRMRNGELIAGGSSLGVGLVASLLSKSALPLLVSLATIGVLFMSYEYTLYSVNAGMREATDE